MNVYVSDLIPVKQILPDARTQYCRDIEENDLKDLPRTSIIVLFRNEAWSTLIRSLHSILDRTPDNLVEEIILLDDNSDPPHTQKQLEDYIANFQKVKIIRSSERLGLIRARILAASHAVGPILTFMESHMEATIGWLEPLLDRIARNPTTVVCLQLNSIDSTTFEYHFNPSGEGKVGGFNWELNFNWHSIPDVEKAR